METEPLTKIDTQSQRITAVMLRLCAIIGALDVLRYLPSTYLYYQNGIAKNQDPDFLNQIRLSMGFNIIFLALVIAVFFSAETIAVWICPENETVEIESKSGRWPLLVLQFTGLLLLINGLGTVGASIKEILVHSMLVDSQMGWNVLSQVWYTLTYLIAGALLVARPRKISDAFKKFSQN